MQAANIIASQGQSKPSVTQAIAAVNQIQRGKNNNDKLEFELGVKALKIAFSEEMLRQEKRHDAQIKSLADKYQKQGTELEKALYVRDIRDKAKAATEAGDTEKANRYLALIAGRPYDAPQADAEKDTRTTREKEYEFIEGLGLDLDAQEILDYVYNRKPEDEEAEDAKTIEETRADLGGVADVARVGLNRAVTGLNAKEANVASHNLLSAWEDDKASAYPTGYYNTKNTLRQIAENKLGQADKTAYQGIDELYEGSFLMEDLLAGLDEDQLGKLPKTFQDIATWRGAGDPQLVEVANTAAFMLSAFLKAQSGTAVTEDEFKRISALFLRLGVNREVNEAALRALQQFSEAKYTGMLERALGTNAGQWAFVKELSTTKLNEMLEKADAEGVPRADILKRLAERGYEVQDAQ